MIIIGAKGHAKEIFDCINPIEYEKLYFFDNINQNIGESLYNYEIIKDFESVKKIFEQDSRFIIGIGGALHRFNLYKIFTDLSGTPNSLISKKSQISTNSNLGKGLNLMPFVSIFAGATVEDGCLINSHVSIHHDSKIGCFSEISPGAKILGNCSIGAYTTIGTNATILPNITIGSNVIVAAGAVVTKNIPNNCMVAGIPAILKKKLPEIIF